MSYEQINPISSVELAPPASPPVQVQVRCSGERLHLQSWRSKPKETKTQVESKPAVMGDNVSLKFIVDNESNNITVLVLDKSNNKIIRAIPPEELNQFREGDLLSLFA